jgi:hypothetical protein
VFAPKKVETNIEEINEAWMQAGDVEAADVASNSDKQLEPDRKITIWHDRKEKYFTKWVDEKYITYWRDASNREIKVFKSMNPFQDDEDD